MIELNIKEFHKVMPIFQGIEHNQAILFSVIEGHNPGKVLVNDIDNPTTALVYTSANFFYFGGDEEDLPFIHDAKVHIVTVLHNGNDKSAVVFSFTEEWRKKLDIELADKGAIRINRKILDFDLRSFEEQNSRRYKLEQDYITKSIGEDVAPIFDVNVDWGSVENFMMNSFGFYLIHENDIVSECHVGYIGTGLAEIGVYTEEKYRGKGYASAMVSAVIEKCLSLGLCPCWSCWDINIASISLAKKVGFIDRSVVQAHYWVEA